MSAAKLRSETIEIIRQSDIFRAKPQILRLLGYLFDHSNDPAASPLSQRTIAINCLGRDLDFDSNKDPIVRMEMTRLRRLLDVFYASPDAKQVPFRITMPLGVYKLDFSKRQNRIQSTGLSMLLICQGHEGATEALSRLVLEVRYALAMRLSGFEHINLAVDFFVEHEAAETGVAHLLTEAFYDYILRVELVNDLNQNFLISSTVIHRPTQEIIWSQCAELPCQFTPDKLEHFYRSLISPLAGDVFGIPAQHWSDYYWRQGVEKLDPRYLAFVCIIRLINKPSRKDCQLSESLLRTHLRENPDDLNGHFCYMFLGCFDYALNYQLIGTCTPRRLSRCQELAAYVPEHAGILALLSFNYFAAGDYERATLYSGDAIRLCPDNNLWRFMSGGFGLLEKRESEGLRIIHEIMQYNEESPLLYYIALFFYHLGAGRFSKAASLALRVEVVDDLRYLVHLLMQIETHYSTVGSTAHAQWPAAEVNWLDSELLNQCPKIKKVIQALQVRLNPD